MTPPAPWPALLALCAGLGGLALGSAPAAAQQVQLRCDGTLLEARGRAQSERPIERLRLSLGLEAEGADAAEALALLQRRLAAVRAALERLAVEELVVTSPSSGLRPARDGRPPRWRASLRVSGALSPERLQELVRELGGLEGVRLAPVVAEADGAKTADLRRRLLEAAYRDALAQAGEMAAVIGRGTPLPLQVQIQGSLRPQPLAMAAREGADVAPFDPGELPRPIERLELEARFCAR